MGITCSCSCGFKGHRPGTIPPKSDDTDHQGSVVQSANEPKLDENGFEDLQKRDLSTTTAVKFGINLDPAVAVAVAAKSESPDHVLVIQENMGGVCVDSSKWPISSANETINNNQTDQSRQGQGQGQGVRGSLPPNTFRTSTSTGGQRMSEDFQTIDAIHRDFSTE